MIGITLPFSTLAVAQDPCKSIRNVLNEQAAAWNRGDIDGFMEGYWNSEEMTFVSGNSQTSGWKAALERYRRNYDSRQKMGTLSFSELEVKMLGTDAAFVRGRFTLERDADRPTGLFTLIFRRIEGKWRIVHDHTSS